MGRLRKDDGSPSRGRCVRARALFPGSAAPNRGDLWHLALGGGSRGERPALDAECHASWCGDRERGVGVPCFVFGGEVVSFGVQVGQQRVWFNLEFKVTFIKGV